MIKKRISFALRMTVLFVGLNFLCRWIRYLVKGDHSATLRFVVDYPHNVMLKEIPIFLLGFLVWAFFLPSLISRMTKKPKLD